MTRVFEAIVAFGPSDRPAFGAWTAVWPDPWSWVRAGLGLAGRDGR